MKLPPFIPYTTGFLAEQTDEGSNFLRGNQQNLQALYKATGGLGTFGDNMQGGVFFEQHFTTPAGWYTAGQNLGISLRIPTGTPTVCLLSTIMLADRSPLNTAAQANGVIFTPNTAQVYYISGLSASTSYIATFLVL